MRHPVKPHVVTPRCLVIGSLTALLCTSVILSLLIALQPDPPLIVEQGWRILGSAVFGVGLVPYNWQLHVQTKADADSSVVHRVILDHRLSFVDNETQTEWLHHVSPVANHAPADGPVPHTVQTAYRFQNDSTFRLVYCQLLEIPDVVHRSLSTGNVQTAIAEHVLPWLLRTADAVVHVQRSWQTNETHDLIPALDAKGMACSRGEPAPNPQQITAIDQKQQNVKTAEGRGRARSRASAPQEVVGACSTELLGNGVCDKACNSVLWKWDGGDCCRQTRIKSSSSSPYDCKQGPRVLLLHGASWNVVNSPHLNLQFSDTSPSIATDVRKAQLWGTPLLDAIREYASEIILNSHNTVDVDWSHPELQRTYYDKAKQIVDGGGIVFAHSFANLLLAAACYDQGLCHVKWHAVAPALRGIHMLDLSWPVHGMAVNLNLTAIRSMRPQYRNMSSGFLERSVLEHDQVLSTVCGYSPLGSGGFVGTELAYLTRLTGNSLFGDGVVSVTECSGLADWQPSSIQANNSTSASTIGTTNNRLTFLPVNHQDLAGVTFEQRLATSVLDWYTRGELALPPTP